MSLVILLNCIGAAIYIAILINDVGSNGTLSEAFGEARGLLNLVHLTETGRVQMAESTQATSSGSADASRDDSLASRPNGSDELRARSAQKLSELKDRLADAQDVVKTKYRVVSESTDDFVHDSPWKAVTMALIGGLIIGMLAAR
ncbi:DUF883 family protein [Paraburkholderia caledonica]|uniref:ElaB/YqjD/DUF883 family membrane-anchored ribosome-binding protein n=1 Tax=Paraburkholderia caledonica TaxID=134536 RepID=A0AB73IBR6_9BURK|nr:ElaB/YqjD/DUF883 family membrane-anchored ribosome-binding protein [Paraburkholderia caledonica]